MKKKVTSPLVRLLNNFEGLCSNKVEFFENFFSQTNLPISKKNIIDAIGKGSYLEKAHSDDISDFVENHEVVMKIFGNKFMEWGNTS